MTGGTYTLLVSLATPAIIAVGALGSHDLPAVTYGYTGSAVGPGGFARVERHRAVAAGHRDVRHWHVDYLLGHDAASVVGVVRSPGVEAECAVARELPPGPVPGFGASNCGCDAHLARFAGHAAARERVTAAHEAVRPAAT